MTERDDELEERLKAAAAKWRMSLPTVSAETAGLKHGGRSRAALLAAAAVLVAIAVPAALVASHDKKQPDRKPTGHQVETPAKNLPLSNDEVDLALTIAKQEQARVKGTFVGAVVAPVILSEPIENSHCPLDRLLRLRIVWQSDASFDHGGIGLGKGGPPDGPLKAFLLFVDPVTKKICSQGAQYYSVGARDEEALLYGTRPVDPTGDFRVFGADRVKVQAANGKKGYADKTVLNALGVTLNLGNSDEALRYQRFQDSLNWKIVPVGIYTADGSTKLGDQYISHTGGVACEGGCRDPQFVTYPGINPELALISGRLFIRNGCLGFGDGREFVAVAFPAAETSFSKGVLKIGTHSYFPGAKVSFGGGFHNVAETKKLAIPDACQPYVGRRIALIYP